MNSAKVLNYVYPGTVTPGQLFQVSVTMLNNGDTTWTAGSQYRLGSQDPQDNFNWMILNRVQLPNDVPPGTSVTFTFTLAAPNLSEPVQADWQMVQDFVAWFGEKAVGTIQIVQISTDTFPAPLQGSLVSGRIITSPQNPINGTRHIIRWTNNSGVDLRITKAYLWSGVDSGTLADVHAQATRLSDGSILIWNQWDRYAEPTAPNNGIYQDYSPPFLLANGDSLDMLYFGNPGNNLQKHSQHSLTIWAY